MVVCEHTSKNTQKLYPIFIYQLLVTLKKRADVTEIFLTYNSKFIILSITKETAPIDVSCSLNVVGSIFRLELGAIK